MVQLLKQDQYIPFDAIDQCISIFAAANGFLDDLDLDAVHSFESDLLEFFGGPKKSLRDKLADTKSFKGLKEEFTAAVRDFKANWTAPVAGA